MNLLEIHVTNITAHVEENGLHQITADFDCYGKKECQKTKWLTEMDYKMIKERGYYLG